VLEEARADLIVKDGVTVEWHDGKRNTIDEDDPGIESV
jgi:hypothetical protein